MSWSSTGKRTLILPTTLFGFGGVLLVNGSAQTLRHHGPGAARWTLAIAGEVETAGLSKFHGSRASATSTSWTCNEPAASFRDLFFESFVSHSQKIHAHTKYEIARIAAVMMPAFSDVANNILRVPFTCVCACVPERVYVCMCVCVCDLKDWLGRNLSLEWMRRFMLARHIYSR